MAPRFCLRASSAAASAREHPRSVGAGHAGDDARLGSGAVHRGREWLRRRRVVNRRRHAHPQSAARRREAHPQAAQRRREARAQAAQRRLEAHAYAHAVGQRRDVLRRRGRPGAGHGRRHRRRAGSSLRAAWRSRAPARRRRPLESARVGLVDAPGRAAASTCALPVRAGATIAQLSRICTSGPASGIKDVDACV